MHLKPVRHIIQTISLRRKISRRVEKPVLIQHDHARHPLRPGSYNAKLTGCVFILLRPSFDISCSTRSALHVQFKGCMGQVREYIRAKCEDIFILRLSREDFYSQNIVKVFATSMHFRSFLYIKYSDVKNNSTAQDSVTEREQYRQ